MKVKNIVVLGSTGSIGINTLDVISRFPDRFRVLGLTAYNNVSVLQKQILKFSPAYVGVGEKGFSDLEDFLVSKPVRLLNVDRDDLSQLVTLPEADIVVIGMSGRAALEPFLAAVQAGKTVTPANKEALVIAGDIIMKAAEKHKAKVIPVDSEQSAIFQCLEGQEQQDLNKIYLTASGGALARVPKRKFDQLSVSDILNHPRWRMGKKITVDSATLMNKGFEIIEAIRLFNVQVGQVEVLIHPEAIIHSMVEFKDGSLLAQLGVTDMRLPIQYALTYPERWETGLPKVNFFDLKKLTFKRPDLHKFPSLSLAFDVARKGGTFPSVLNAADEVAVDGFLRGDVLFSQIYEIVEKIVSTHKGVEQSNLNAILEADAWAREEAFAWVRKFKTKKVLARK